MARYTQTPITFGKNPNTNREDRYPRYTNVKYPLIPRSINDIYILVAEGDRYDILAQTYYQDSSLWWIISTSNSNTKQDYKWVDNGPLANAFNYYRLLQYDIDGANEMYGPVMIDNRNKIYKIIRRIDMMGREVGPDAKGVVIEIYEDGTMIRTINK